ncbi:MAG: signal recognition particle-docking protein FtsY [Anaerolineales bacterium]|nr:signal recognition particle-docking protein FtsY [Anaerolineales bacterium]
MSVFHEGIIPYARITPLTFSRLPHRAQRGERVIMLAMEKLINKWKNGLEKTRKTTFGKISNFLGTSEINPETWDELEALFIQADLGVETTLELIKALQDQVQERGITRTAELASVIESELLSRIDNPPPLKLDASPSVILIAGVNGSGKTTTMAKLGRYFSDQGKKVLFAAADTYRAGAIDQLKIWGERLDIPVIAGERDGDPGAVTYDAVQSGQARGYDLVLIDTAGRLHTRYNLMEELKKVHRVAGKALPGAPHAAWLVMDATTGQNALHQAEAFQAAIPLDGIILAKLDSSARGGMVFAIQKTLNLPILFAGLGEKPEDLELFDSRAFLQGILGDFGGKS